MISEWNLLERSNLSLVQKIYPNPSPLMEIGPLCSTSPMMRTSLYSLIEPRNSNGTNTIFYSNLQLSKSLSTLESSLLTEPSISESQNVRIYSSPTSTNSMTFKPCTLTTTVPPNLVVLQEVAPPTFLTNPLSESGVNLAETGIKESVQGETVITTMSTKYVSKRDMLAISAQAKAL